MKSTIKTIALATLIAINRPAYSFFGAFGATEFTQILNNLELVQQVIDTKRQFDTMLTNLEKLKDFVDNGAQLVGIMDRLQNAVRYGQALAYNAEDLSRQFNDRYKDFTYFVQKQSKNNSKYNVAIEKDRYQKWSRQNLDNIHSALRAANLQSKYFQDEASTIKEIEFKAKTAVGRDQLLQAAIEIAAQQAKQMVELRQLIAADIQMQANYKASLIDKQAEKDAQRIKALEPYDGTDPNPNDYNYRWQQ